VLCFPPADTGRSPAVRLASWLLHLRACCRANSSCSTFSTSSPGSASSSSSSHAPSGFWCAYVALLEAAGPMTAVCSGAWGQQELQQLEPPPLRVRAGSSFLTCVSASSRSMEHGALFLIVSVLDRNYHDAGVVEQPVLSAAAGAWKMTISSRLPQASVYSHKNQCWRACFMYTACNCAPFVIGWQLAGLNPYAHCCCCCCCCQVWLWRQHDDARRATLAAYTLLAAGRHPVAQLGLASSSE
jgi:hypothetical protein